MALGQDSPTPEMHDRTLLNSSLHVLAVAQVELLLTL